MAFDDRLKDEDPTKGLLSAGIKWVDKDGKHYLRFITPRARWQGCKWNKEETKCEVCGSEDEFCRNDIESMHCEECKLSYEEELIFLEDGHICLDCYIHGNKWNKIKQDLEESEEWKNA